MRKLFKSRLEAGLQLGQFLQKNSLSGSSHLLALPRGGVEIGFEVAKILNTTFDIVVVRKLAHPENPEYGLGAISEDEVPFYNPNVARFSQELNSEMKVVLSKEVQELRRRVSEFRGYKLNFQKEDSLIVIDDGIATGVTAAAAGKFLRSFSPRHIKLAVPVAPKKIPEFLTEIYDEVISLHYISNFRGVGEWYENFPQLDDHQVLAYLGKESLFYHP